MEFISILDKHSSDNEYNENDYLNINTTAIHYE